MSNTKAYTDIIIINVTISTIVWLHHSKETDTNTKINYQFYIKIIILYIIQNIIIIHTIVIHIWMAEKVAVGAKTKIKQDPF